MLLLSELPMNWWESLPLSCTPRGTLSALEGLFTWALA